MPRFIILLIRIYHKSIAKIVKTANFRLEVGQKLLVFKGRFFVKFYKNLLNLLP